ncbi:hypothetical protein ACSNOI_04390 [Actinomadura kijaniata]|uniref:hypothetical protein n=1 Tax=Actinomadura kijaniata TaxID=46161 RepID=UPI003F1DAE87
MGQPSMRITVDAAMRAREVSRPLPEGEREPAPPGAAEPGRSGRAAKNERRRLGKRGGGARLR